MSQKGSSSEVSVCRLRIDPVLVEKFRSLGGGINAVGTRIVRDIGLKYEFDNKTGNFYLIGQDTDLLALAVETLRFWAEEDEFPNTGVTCHVGYPNRGFVVWRFHGDYAKKFDHLFTEDIARLKLIPSVNIKAVPTKRNPEYVELFCYFSVFQKLKEEVDRITVEIGKVFQEDFFIPQSDRKKAKKFAVSNRKDDKVLYALKDYPENKVRVWIFARKQADLVRARRDWLNHIEILARESEFVETPRRPDVEIMSASFIGDAVSSVTSENAGPGNIQNGMNPATVLLNASTSSLKTNKRHSRMSDTVSFNKELSPRGPKIDNSNFPRPPDFVYPVQKEGHLPQQLQEAKDMPVDRFSNNPFLQRTVNASGIPNTELIGEARWITDDGNYLQKLRRSTNLSNRIYVHHQVSNQNDQTDNQQNMPATAHESTEKEQVAVSPRKTRNSIKVDKPSASITGVTNRNVKRHLGTKVSSVTRAQQTVAQKRANNLARFSDKSVKQQTKPAPKMQRRPRTLKSQRQAQQPVVKYHINISGLNIYMYKDDITKVKNVDALVNVVLPDLKHGDTVAKTILDEVGKQVIDEIDVHLSLHDEVETTDNIVTSAGKLPALGIIHVVCPVWKQYTVWEACATDLHKAIYNVLKTAESHKYRKIAIPTIGPGW